MAQFQPVPILTEHFLRGIFTGMIFIIFGKQSLNHSGTEAGQKPGNVQIAMNTRIARAMDSITGMVIKRMY